MRESLLYTLHSHRDGEEGGISDVRADPRYFKQVYRSKYGKVRIFQIVNTDQESKAWVADVRNKVCDDDGRGWQCRGQYPPALEEVLREKRDFQQEQQLEFRSTTELEDSHEIQYFEDSYGLSRPHSLAGDMEDDDQIHMYDPDCGCEEDDDEYEDEEYEQEQCIHEENTDEDAWADTEETTKMWRIITSGEVNDLEAFLKERPTRATIRYVHI